MQAPLHECDDRARQGTRRADEPYQAEDVIEIVPYDADHVYVRAHLDFYNGHSCGIAGMARYEHGVFVYRDTLSLSVAGYPPCTLKVGVEHGQLTLTDRRRTIRYLDRLKASREYKRAVDDLRAAS